MRMEGRALGIDIGGTGIKGAVVDLADGSTQPVMALQSADGPRATRAAREIAALIADRSRTERDD